MARDLDVPGSFAVKLGFPKAWRSGPPSSSLQLAVFEADCMKGHFERRQGLLQVVSRWSGGPLSTAVACHLVREPDVAPFSQDRRRR